jgi:hypothetical protein
MPKDEFDFEDPLELNGVAFLTDEDTTEAMTECFVEEFLRMGYNHKQIFALFRNRNYTGLNMVLQNRGEQFVRDYITSVFARWGAAVTWPEGENSPEASPEPITKAEPAVTADPADHFDPTATDPMGGAAPKINY